MRKALTLICRRIEGCVARTGGAARMGLTKAVPATFHLASYLNPHHVQLSLCILYRSPKNGIRFHT